MSLQRKMKSDYTGKKKKTKQNKRIKAKEIIYYKKRMFSSIFIVLRTYTLAD